MHALVIRLKRAIAQLVQNHAVGTLVGWIYGDLIPFHGHRIDVQGTGISPPNKVSLLLGMYESAEYRFVRDYLLSDVPVIELGSSIGAVSSVIAARLRPGQHLTCVEANPKLIPTLKRNLDRNGSHLDVDVIHAAVAYGVDSVPFIISDNNLVSNVAARPVDGITNVPTVSLSDLLARGRCTSFQLVADIEGAELDVLLHDRDALRLCRVMIMELHDTHRDAQAYSKDDLASLVVAAGFQIIARYGSVIVCRKTAGDAC